MECVCVRHRLILRYLECNNVEICSHQFRFIGAWLEIQDSNATQRTSKVKSWRWTACLPIEQNQVWCILVCVRRTYCGLWVTRTTSCRFCVSIIFIWHWRVRNYGAARVHCSFCSLLHFITRFVGCFSSFSSSASTWNVYVTYTTSNIWWIRTQALALAQRAEKTETAKFLYDFIANAFFTR